MTAFIRIGSRIRERRQRMNLTQAQLADCLRVPLVTVQGWESGEALDEIVLLQQICAVLNCQL